MFGLIAGLLMSGFVALWDYKLDGLIRKGMRKHLLDEELKRTGCVFIDPRSES